MKQPSVFVKVGVIASSVLLVAALVCYRAGAIDGLNERARTPQADENQSNSKTALDSGQLEPTQREAEALFPHAELPPYPEKKPATIMWGTKSSIAFTDIPFPFRQEIFNPPDLEWNRQTKQSPTRVEQLPARKGAFDSESGKGN